MKFVSHEGEKPEYLYKYRRLSELTLRMLAEGKYYFASPRDFNDPLDCAVDPVYALPPIEKIVEFQTRILQDTHGYGYDEAFALSGSLRRLSEPDLKSFFDRVRENVKGILENEFGILSLSEKNDHILMWSHYSDYHKGFCIEFRRSQDNPLAAAKPVQYYDQYPNFGYFDDLPGNIAKKIILSKACVWRYEAEWRGINKASSEVRYDDEMLSGIIFGLRTPEDHKKQIRQILKGKDRIRFYQAELMDRKFELTVKPIDHK